MSRGISEAGRSMTIARLISGLNAALTPDMSVICDVGDCLFAAHDLRVHERTPANGCHAGTEDEFEQALSNALDTPAGPA